MTTHPMRGKWFRNLFDAAADAMVVIDPQEAVVALNREGERLLGWTEAELLGEPLNSLLAPRFQQVSNLPGVTDPASQDVVADSPANLFAQRRDGSEFPAEFNRSPLDISQDALVLVTIHDLTKSRRAQESLFREKERAVVTLASIADAVLTTDLAGTITYLNPTAERLTGWRSTEALGQPLSTVLTLISEATRQPIEDVATRCLREGRAVDLADGVVLLRRDGTEVTIGDSAAPLSDRDGSTVGVVLVFHDVTEKRRAARELSHEATHDALTGLVNRKEFERRLARVLAEVAGGAAEHALCFLDLDRFKIVNDTCGHEAGDDLLRTIARLLAGRLRGRDTFGRLGGDEFGVLLEYCSLAKAKELATSFRQTIEELRYRWEKTPFSITASIGVVPITAASERTADLLRAADNACYAVKETGGNRVQVVEAGVSPEEQQRLEAKRITRLARAAGEEGFELFVQPIVPLAPEHPSRHRCEILLHLPGDGSAVETSDFRLHADRHRLTPEIDRWVVRQTIALLSDWHRDHPECELPICSINLSVSSLDDADLVPTIRAYLRQYELPSESLSFEIAEAAALGNFAQLVRLISEIGAMGCGVGLDDFGHGLASFAHLKALRVDYVKIGGHYVRGVVDDPVYGSLVNAVNDIGRIIGITTIAAEVESEPILNKLRALGIGYAQGHAVAPAAPLADTRGKAALPCIPRSS